MNWNEYIQKHMGSVVYLPSAIFTFLFTNIQEHPPYVIKTKTPYDVRTKIGLVQFKLLCHGLIVLKDAEKKNPSVSIVVSKPSTLERVLSSLPSKHHPLLTSLSDPMSANTFLQRYFSPSFTTLVMKQATSGDSTLFQPAFSSMQSFAPHLPSSLFHRIQLAAQEALQRDNNHVLNTNFFYWSCTTTPETIIVHLHHHSNSVEMRRIAVFFARCAAKFHWDGISTTVSDVSSIAYPMRYALVLYMIPLTMHFTQTLYNSFFYSKKYDLFNHPCVLFSHMTADVLSTSMEITAGQCQLLTFMSLCLITRSLEFAERDRMHHSKKRMRTVTELSIVYHRIDGEQVPYEQQIPLMTFNKHSHYARLSAYKMISCSDESLRGRLWCMLQCVKHPLKLLISDLHQCWMKHRLWSNLALWTKMEWLVSSYLFVTLFDVEKDPRSQEFNSIFVKPKIDYYIAYRIYRILYEHHSHSPLSISLMCCLDPVLNKIKRHEYEEPELPNIGYVDIPTNGYQTLALLFEFAYQAQCGVLHVPSSERYFIEHLYCGTIDLQLCRRPPKRKPYSKVVEAKTLPDEVIADYCFLEECTEHFMKDVTDHTLFGIMMRLIECATCDACCEGRTRCVHFSYKGVHHFPFENLAMLQTTSNRLISVARTTSFFHMLFAGAEDFALRAHVADVCPDLLCHDLFVPKSF